MIGMMVHCSTPRSLIMRLGITSSCSLCMWLEIRPLLCEWNKPFSQSPNA